MVPWNLGTRNGLLGREIGDFEIHKSLELRVKILDGIRFKTLVAGLAVKVMLGLILSLSQWDRQI